MFATTHFWGSAVNCSPEGCLLPVRRGHLNSSRGGEGRRNHTQGSFIKKIYLAYSDNGLSELKITPREKLIGSYK